ncbi:MAG: GAF domain-containing SpoIIE family protein phosphatase [Planctomycetota bacterium]|nr:GAF domain-containing SpoIIE family protein phosphatase [Planctomycetota bacterium]
MQLAPIPKNESDRLASLRALQILDSPAEQRFDRITQLAQKMFKVPIAYIAMIDSDRQWFKSKCGLTTDETGRDVSFCGHAINQDDPLIIPDTLTDERFSDNPLVINDPHIRFYMGIPLAGPGGFNVGTLCIADREPRALEDLDVDAMQYLADMACHELNMVDVIRTQKELLDAKTMLIRTQQRQASELKEAAKYARSLIPPRLTEGPVTSDWLYEACSELGGDVLGHLDLPNGHKAFYLVDVMGHGIGAALHGSAIQSAIRSQSLPDCDFTDPLSVFHALNRRFPMADHGNRFCTMFYGVLDPESGLLNYVNAGHPPPFLFSNVSSPRTIDSTASLVGIDEGQEAGSDSIQLTPGSELWIYSDAAIEIKDASGHDMGVDGLRDAISLVRSTGDMTNPTASMRQLLATFTGSDVFEDDLSLLVITWHGASQR